MKTAPNFVKDVRYCCNSNERSDVVLVIAFVTTHHLSHPPGPVMVPSGVNVMTTNCRLDAHALIRRMITV